MEVVRGTSLAELVARHGPMSPGTALAVIEPLAAALDHAHGLGVIHRDVKPENIMVEIEDGRVRAAKLLDFGIAAELESFHTRLTGNLPAGTLAYMSPEQIACQSVGARSDVYALGATLHHMLAGRPPFTGPDLSRSIRFEEPDELEDSARALRAVLRSALAKDPARRPASAGQLARRLRLALCFPADEDD
jgi:serine/threonine-protein kinase